MFLKKLRTLFQTLTLTLTLTLNRHYYHVFILLSSGSYGKFPGER